MTNAAELIVKGMKIEALPNLPRAFDGLRRCAVTGELIESGYLVSDITTPASNEFMDTFRGDPCGVVSETVGRAFRNDHNMGARLFFEDGTMYYPLISRESAAKDGNLHRQPGRDRAADRPHTIPRQEKSHRVRGGRVLDRRGGQRIRTVGRAEIAATGAGGCQGGVRGQGELWGAFAARRLDSASVAVEPVGNRLAMRNTDRAAGGGNY